MSTLQPIINRPAPLSAAVMSLSWKETLDLFKRLNGGTVGFDYGQYRLADLRNVLSAWIAQGVPADVIEGHATGILGTRAAKATIIPPAPVAAAFPPAPVAAPALPPLPADSAAPASVAPSVRDSLAEAIAAAQALTALTHPATVAAGLVPPAPIQGVQATGVIVDEFVPRNERAEPGPLLTGLPATPITAAPAQPVSVPHGYKLAREVFHDLPRAIIDAIPATLSIPVFANPDAEAIDYDYRYTAATLVDALIAMAQTPTQRVWCGGPRGTGKTEFVRALAARTGRALYRVSFNRFTEASEIVGDMGLRNGNTEWVDGPVALALRVKDGSAVLLLDEITYGSAGALACLNGLLEQRGAAVRLPRTGETLPVHPHLWIAAADNTFGAGSATGEYVARNELGPDLRDRFAYKLAFDFLPTADERELLRAAIQKQTGRKPSAAAMAPIMNLLKTCRAKADSGELQGAPSFRGAVAFATLLAFGQRPADAWTTAVVLGAPDSSHEALRLVFASVWPSDSTGNLTTFQGEI